MSLHDALLAKAFGGGGSGGSASIDVTATVGQTIVVEEVDANGKPTKWKSADYQEKICGEKEAVLLNETTVEIDPDMGMGYAVGNHLMEEGNTYTVKYNGTTYDCVAVFTEVGITIGNLAAITGEGDTGEPFVIGSVNDDGVIAYAVFLLDGATSGTLSITGAEVVKIPDKYFSDATKVCYIEIYTEDGVNYTTTATPKYLREQFARGRAISLKIYGQSVFNLNSDGIDFLKNVQFLSLVRNDSGIYMTVITLDADDDNSPYSITKSEYLVSTREL